MKTERIMIEAGERVIKYEGKIKRSENTYNVCIINKYSYNVGERWKRKNGQRRD